MFSWITSWWSSSAISGPARNAPNEGKNIKEIIDQKPAEVSILTQEEIIAVKNNLRKTGIRETIDFTDDNCITFTNTISLKSSPEKQKHPLTMVVTQEQVVTIKNGLKKTATNTTLPSPITSPIVEALNTVFSQGNAKYFENIRTSREAAKNKVPNPEFVINPVTSDETPQDETLCDACKQEIFFEGTKMECRSEITCEELMSHDETSNEKANFTQADIAAEVCEFSGI